MYPLWCCFDSVMWGMRFCWFIKCAVAAWMVTCCCCFCSFWDTGWSEKQEEGSETWTESYGGVFCEQVFFYFCLFWSWRFVFNILFYEVCFPALLCFVLGFGISRGRLEELILVLYYNIRTFISVWKRL